MQFLYVFLKKKKCLAVQCLKFEEEEKLQITESYDMKSLLEEVAQLIPQGQLLPDWNVCKKCES